MDTTKLSRQLGQIVDLMRKDERQVVSLRDIASITEALISVIRSYFNTLDTSIYRELHQLSGHISEAKTEIARLRPNEIKAQLPAAGDQLEAIVKGTEQATHSIMEATEQILAASAGESKGNIEDACMRIFEACSFQDITGQRVTKVVKTLNYIEQRISITSSSVSACCSRCSAPRSKRLRSRTSRRTTPFWSTVRRSRARESTRTKWMPCSATTAKVAAETATRTRAR